MDDPLHLVRRSTPLLTKGSDEQDLLGVLRCYERHYFARFGTNDPMAKFETVLTPEQVARVESLMDVPMHLLAMDDDQIDREILATQRLRRDLSSTPLYREKDKQGWVYWSTLFGSQVNSLRK